MSRILKQARLSKKRRQLKNEPIEIVEEIFGDSDEVISEEEEEKESPRSPEEEAFLILERAKASANELVEKTKHDGVEIERRSREEGYKKGYDEGYELAYKEGLEAGRKELEGIVSALRTALQGITELKKDLHRETEEEIVEIIIGALRKILMDEVQTNPETVFSTVKNALKRARDKERIIIRVNPEDIQTIKNHKQELLEQIDGIKHLEFEEDSKIGRGGCILESDSGKIDARLENQLMAVEQALRSGGDLRVESK